MKTRINSIDMVRGLVMIIMTLDHTRDLLHINSITESPTNFDTTTTLLFFTRWVTHFCAPVFVFLSGTSAYLSFRSRGDLAFSRKFLLTRGSWLILLEFTFVGFGIWFDIHFAVLLFDVIAAIGFGFIILALLLRTTPKTIGIIGLVIIFCHDLFPLLPLSDGSLLKNILSPFFLPDGFALGKSTTFMMAYPPVPWLGIMLVGFACGQFFEWPSDRRIKLFTKMGLAALILFVIARVINVYGDPLPWSTQKNGVFTMLSFINVTKYPPSLFFSLLTLGTMFLVLSRAEHWKGTAGTILVTYGRVPLFYFLAHFYLIHLLMFAMVFLQGFKPADLVFGSNFGRPLHGGGVTLWVIYVVWIFVVAALFPVCRWYGKYKLAHKDKRWVSYL